MFDEDQNLADDDSIITSDTNSEKSTSSSNIKKLLAQRNEYKTKAEKVELLEKELIELKDLVIKSNLEVDERVENIKKEKELELFFVQNSNLSDKKDDILNAQKQYWMSLEDAKIFVLAKQWQAIPQQTKTITWVWQPKSEIDFSNVTLDQLKNLSSKEFEAYDKRLMLQR